ncbi:MAG: Rhodoferax phage, partial [Pseudomonadota bacterium]
MPLPTTPSPATSLTPEDKARYRRQRIMAMPPEQLTAVRAELEQSGDAPDLLAEIDAIRPQESLLSAVGRGLRRGLRDLTTVVPAAPMALGEQIGNALLGTDTNIVGQGLANLAEAEQADDQRRGQDFAERSTTNSVVEGVARSVPIMAASIPLAAGSALTGVAARSAVAAVPGGLAAAGQSIGQDIAAGGYSPARRILRAGLQGGLEVVTEAVPIFGHFGGEAKFLEAFLARADRAGLGAAAAKALANTTRAVGNAGMETQAQGAQEALAGGAQSLADSLTGNEDKGLRQIVADMAREAWHGYLSGVMMGGAIASPSVAAAGVRDTAQGLDALMTQLGQDSVARTGADIQAADPHAADRDALEEALAGLPDAAPDQTIGRGQGSLGRTPGETPASLAAALATTQVPTPPPQIDPADIAADTGEVAPNDPLVDMTPTEIGRFARADTSTPPTKELGQVETQDVDPISTGFDQYLAETGMTAEQHAKLSAGTEDLVPWAPGDRAVVDVGDSPINGKGIVAKQDLQPGQPAVTAMDDEGHRTPVGRYLNHSDTPNAAVALTDTGITVVPLRPIAAGEELTIDYRQSRREQAKLRQRMQEMEQTPTVDTRLNLPPRGQPEPTGKLDGREGEREAQQLAQVPPKPAPVASNQPDAKPVVEGEPAVGTTQAPQPATDPQVPPREAPPVRGDQ